MIKTGIGYDVHPLAVGETLIIGGVEIDSPMGSVGHSDGDVLLHGIVDALLGATNLGDIGQHFPSSDKRWEGKNSLHFLTYAIKLVRNQGYEVVHIDSTVILEEPKLSGIIPEIADNISTILRVDTSCVSVKATTTDKMGFIGRGEGIGAVAVATISRE